MKKVEALKVWAEEELKKLTTSQVGSEFRNGQICFIENVLLPKLDEVLLAIQVRAESDRQ